jgi:DNA modification methylase
MTARIKKADCLDLLRLMPGDRITAVVTDPPYGLGFMGKGWDKVLPDPAIWFECLRVLKPGGVALVFGGTRTFHRIAVALEDAGFEIRDVLAWIYGSGFPKSLAIDKAIDKADGLERSKTGRVTSRTGARKSAFAEERADSASGFYGEAKSNAETLPASDRSRPWHGYGTALKPAWEPIILAMKPTDGTFAQNALRHGVAGLNVDGCRIGDTGGTMKGNPPKGASTGIYGHGINGACDIIDIGKGRWPANVAFDEDAADLLGEPSRFFYCAKASKRDRGEGNNHPTVKPTDLMRWLVRMVKMPSGTLVLDPFMGSGTTGVACVEEDVDFLGIERDAGYFKIARRRIFG